MLSSPSSVFASDFQNELLNFSSSTRILPTWTLNSILLGLLTLIMLGEQRAYKLWSDSLWNFLHVLYPDILLGTVTKHPRFVFFLRTKDTRRKQVTLFHGQGTRLTWRVSLLLCIIIMNFVGLSSVVFWTVTLTPWRLRQCFPLEC